MLARIRSSLQVPAIRYAAASVAAMGLDFAIALTLRATTPLALSVSAAISFITSGAIFYFVHEYWTFKRAGSTASAGRLVRNLMVLGLSFTTRVGVIALLEHIYNPNLILSTVYLVIGAGVSFTINYLANKYWVFRSAAG